MSNEPVAERPVALVIGTRPEAVKMAPVAWALRDLGMPFHVVLTAQHRGLLDQMLPILGLRADIDLDLMRPDQRLDGFGAKALAALGDVFRNLVPSMVLVQGDTSTVFFAALAAFYERIPVGHVEAGLRSHDLARPFPEEANRRLTAQITRLHFAPTEKAKENLLAEGIDPERIFVTGNTVVDSLGYVAGKLDERDPSPVIAPVVESSAPIVLVTVHRRESFGKPLRRIFSAISDIARARPEVEVVYPVHPNPSVRRTAEDILGPVDNVRLLPPVDYLDFIHLMSRARLCLTDSGGVQEEAPSFGLSILVLREKTERPEGVEAGLAELVGSDRRRIVQRALAHLDSQDVVPARRLENPYGDGRAGRRIAEAVAAELNGKP